MDSNHNAELLTNIIAGDWENCLELQDFEKLPAVLSSGSLQFIDSPLQIHQTG